MVAFHVINIAMLICYVEYRKNCLLLGDIQDPMVFKDSIICSFLKANKWSINASSSSNTPMRKAMVSLKPDPVCDSEIDNIGHKSVFSDFSFASWCENDEVYDLHKNKLHRTWLTPKIYGIFVKFQKLLI